MRTPFGGPHSHYLRPKWDFRGGLAAGLAAGCRPATARAARARTNRSMTSSPTLTQVDTRDSSTPSSTSRPCSTSRWTAPRVHLPHGLPARPPARRPAAVGPGGVPVWFRALPRLTPRTARQAKSAMAAGALVAPRAARTAQYPRHRRRPRHEHPLQAGQGGRGRHVLAPESQVPVLPVDVDRARRPSWTHHRQDPDQCRLEAAEIDPGGSSEPPAPRP